MYIQKLGNSKTYKIDRHTHEILHIYTKTNYCDLQHIDYKTLLQHNLNV